MKSIIFGIVFFTVLFGDATAQKTFYKFQVGYGIPLVGSQWTVQTNSSFSTQSFSLGSGLRLEGGVIQNFRKNISLQVDIGYLSGKKNVLHHTAGTDYLNEQYYSRFFDLSPMIRFTVDDAKLKPFISVGPVFAMGTFNRDRYYGTVGSINSMDGHRQFSGGVSVGSKAELGLQIKFGKVYYYAQLEVIYMRYAPVRSDLKYYSVNGVDQLNSLTVSQKQTVYVNSVDYNVSQDPNQPTRSIKTSYPFDSISLNVGMLIKL